MLLPHTPPSYSSLSLHMPMSRQPPAGVFAACSYGIGGKCDKYLRPRTKDEHTRAALTALLVDEECGLRMPARVARHAPWSRRSLRKIRSKSGRAVSVRSTKLPVCRSKTIMALGCSVSVTWSCRANRQMSRGYTLYSRKSLSSTVPRYECQLKPRAGD